MLTIFLTYLAISAFTTCTVIAACVVSGRPQRYKADDKNTYSAPVLQVIEGVPQV